MKKFLSFILFALFATVGLQAQSLDELKAKKADLEAQQAAKQGEADAFNGEIGDLASQIELLSGWRKGLNGSLGFDLNNSFNWIGNPNTDARSSGLNIGITAFANKTTEKDFWNNKAIINKAWQDVDLTEADRNASNDGLFDNGTVDIVNLSSLYGYKLNDKIAISALGELNTSLSNFLKPGTFDFGAGVTWTPNTDLVVVIHPLNYHVAFPADGAPYETTGAIGAKIRADYTRSLNIGGKEIGWSSTLTSFLPYKNNDPDPTLFEYTWLNTFNFQLYKGIGVALGLGVRNAEFESEDIQSYFNVGLSYGF